MWNDRVTWLTWLWNYLARIYFLSCAFYTPRPPHLNDHAVRFRSGKQGADEHDLPVMRSFCAQLTFSDRKCRHHKQLQPFTPTQPSANHEVLILADQATNFSRQAEQDEGGGGEGPRCRSFVTQVDLVLEKVGALFITSSAEHSTTYAHATYKLQPEHRVKENERSVKNTHYILFLLTSVIRFVSFLLTGYMFPIAPIHHRVNGGYNVITRWTSESSIVFLSCRIPHHNYH